MFGAFHGSFAYDLFMECALRKLGKKEQVLRWNGTEMTFIVAIAAAVVVFVDIVIPKTINIIVVVRYSFYSNVCLCVVYGKCQKRFYVMWNVMKIGFASSVSRTTIEMMHFQYDSIQATNDLMERNCRSLSLTHDISLSLFTSAWLKSCLINIYNSFEFQCLCALKFISIWNKIDWLSMCAHTHFKCIHKKAVVYIPNVYRARIWSQNLIGCKTWSKLIFFLTKYSFFDLNYISNWTDTREEHYSYHADYTISDETNKRKHCLTFLCCGTLRSVA